MTRKYSKQQENIINTTEKLLAQKGYANTSVNEVIKNSGIAKGTFYHYFPSKETLFDGIITRLTEQAHKPIKKIVADPELSAIEKFNAVINFAKQYKLNRKHLYLAISRWIFSDDNIRLRHKLFKHYARFLIPELVEIINQGIKEKTFRVGNPEVAADLVIQLAIAAGEKMGPLLSGEKMNETEKKAFLDTIQGYNEAIERLLGVKEGQLTIYDSSTLAKFFDEKFIVK